MGSLRAFLSRLRHLLSRNGDDDVVAELDAHVRAHIDDRVHAGMNPAEANRDARLTLGGLTQTTEAVRERLRLSYGETTMQDLRYAWRMLLKTPGFTAAAVLTLALGIGATTAIFSVANAVLLKPLPYPRWEDLRTVRTTFTDGKVTSGRVAPAELTRLNDPAFPILRAALSSRLDATLLVNDTTPLSVVAHGVSEGFFELIGLPLTIGPGFGPDYFRPRGPTAVVISHRLWHNVLGADPGIVGKTLRLANGNVPIVGVAARDMDIPQETDVWFNMPIFDPNSLAHSFDGYLRVQPGTNEKLLRSRLSLVEQQLLRDFPVAEQSRAFIVEPLVHSMVGDLRPILVIVLAATGLLLLLACVNVTNLLLARATARGHEMAIRAALGASRWRIVQQVLTESLVLATAGAIAGVLLAYAGVRTLLIYGASKLPRLEAVPFDTSVLLFAGGILIVSALGVGLAPSFQLAGTGLERQLRARGLRGATAPHRALRMMIVAEIAVALVMVAGAGWLVRSFTNLHNSDRGFLDQGRVILDISLPFDHYRDPGARSAWTRTLLDRLRNVRGVTGVATSSDFPMRPDTAPTPLVQMNDRSDPVAIAKRRVVSAEFFRVMGIRMLQGRGFGDEDRATTAPVAIVNESFARRYLDGRDPLRAQLWYGFPQLDPRTTRAIVGVVSDMKYASLWTAAEPTIYMVVDQAWPETFRYTVVVSTALADPSAAIPAIRSNVSELDSRLALKVEVVSTLLASALARQKLGMALMLLFGLVALLLAAIGIYGVIAYASAERRSEMATRMALGATSANIFWLLTRHGGVAAVAGAVLGAGGAYAAGQLVSAWLYEVRPSDPLILALALALVLVVTMVATVIPARRASRIDPALSLRSE